MFDVDFAHTPRTQSLAMWGLITLILLFWILADAMIAHAQLPAVISGTASASAADASMTSSIMGWMQTAIGVVSAIAMVGVLWGVNKTRLADHDKRLACLEASRETDRKDHRAEHEKLGEGLDKIREGVSGIREAIARLQGPKDDNH